VVTGASRGIGEAIATELAASGARVVLAAPGFDPATAATDRLREAGHEAIAVEADVTRHDDVARLVDGTVERFGRLDVLVNNAGIGAIGPSESLPLEVWQRTIDTNLTGVFLCAQAAGRVMIEQRRGVIINIASIFGAVGMPQRAAYAASKHGVVGLTKVLGVEWAPHGVRVVAVNPAYVRTALDETDGQAGGYTQADVERRTPAGRFASAQEVAQVVAFLATDRASFVTGSSVDVDGGWLAYGGW
jgi:3-oxoacyl-[acyl-carrier protein] reductase